MSLPPSRSFADKWYLANTGYNGNSSPLATTDITVIKRQTVAPSRTKTPFRYRIKTWVYRGKTYSRKQGLKPAKSRRILENQWRNPTAYKCSLFEGDVNTFNGFYSYRGNPGDPANHTKREEYGALPATAFGIACPAIPGFTPSLTDRAVVKALNKLKNSDVNLAVAFAERGETAELLANTLSGLAKAARSLRRGNMAGVAKGLGLRGSPKAPRGQNFHNKWLELQYGWQPLYNDVFGAVSALHKADQDDPKRYLQTVKALVKRESESHGSSSPKPAMRGVVTDKQLEFAFVRLDYYLTNPFLASLSQLGITNPAEVIWERVPFSFVVDWFLPVGSYLSAMDAALGWSFRAGSLTKMFRRQWNGFIHAEDNSRRLGFFPDLTYGAVNARQMSMDRSLYYSSPLPRVPRFKNPFPHGDGRHVANAIALFASSLRR